MNAPAGRGRTRSSKLIGVYSRSLPEIQAAGLNLAALIRVHNQGFAAFANSIRAEFLVASKPGLPVEKLNYPMSVTVEGRVTPTFYTNPNIELVSIVALRMISNEHVRPTRHRVPMAPQKRRVVFAYLDERVRLYRQAAAIIQAGRLRWPLRFRRVQRQIQIVEALDAALRYAWPRYQSAFAVVGAG